MRLLRHQSLACLLVTLVTGGLLLPVAHEFQHAHHAAVQADVAPLCDHSQHPVSFEVGYAAYDGSLCSLCARPLVSLAERQAEAEPLRPGAELVSQEPTPVYAAVQALPFARGPPFLF